MVAADLDFSWSPGSVPPTFRVGAPPVETLLVHKGSTPIALDLRCDAVFYQPTGPVVVFKSISEIVQASFSYMSAMAVLPVSAEDEATVEGLVNRRLGSMTVRQVTR